MPQNRELKPTFWLSYYFLATVIVARFLWRVLTSGGSFPLPPFHYYSMVIDLLMLGALMFAKRHVSRWVGYGSPEASKANLAFVPGLIAGVGLLLIRFTSHHAWWTGHLYR